MGLTNCKPSSNNQVNNIIHSNMSHHINNPNNDKLFIESIKYKIKETNTTVNDYLQYDIKFYLETMLFGEEVIVTNIKNEKNDFDVIFKRYMSFDLLEPLSISQCTDQDCSICLDPLTQINNKNMIPVKLKCGHMFHYKCIEKWHHSKQECPLCRKLLHEIIV